jgi:hypothetical protein
VVPGEKATVSLHPEGDGAGRLDGVAPTLAAQAPDAEGVAPVVEDSPAPPSDKSVSSDSGPGVVAGPESGPATVDADDAVHHPVAVESGGPDDPAAEESAVETAPVMGEATTSPPVPSAPPAPPGSAVLPPLAAALAPAAHPEPAVVPPPRAAVDDLRGPTVDLQSHVNATNADPDSTAVLEVRPTVDLSSRVEQPEDSGRRR